MKKKKSKLRTALWLLFTLFICGFVAWVILTPVPKPRQTVRVPVEHHEAERHEEAHELPEQAMLPPPEHPTPEAEEQVAAAIVPVMPEHEQPRIAGQKPEIAIIIDDVGLNLSGSQRAIKLPGFITLSFIPYAERLDEQTTEARDRGHELMLHMPMEPIGRQNPGPGALLTTLSPQDVRARLDHALDSFDGFDGMNNHMGSRFTAYSAGMEIVIEELQKRGLFFLDSRTSAQTVGESIAEKHGLPTISRDVFLDDNMAPDAVKAQLAITERVARRKGHAVAIGHPHEVTLSALEAWIPEAEKEGFIFVPVHTLIKARMTDVKAP
jgi:uncharacterized protein